MEFTAPQDASVVMVAKRAELKMPKRTSLPSMLPDAASTPNACRRGFPADSAHQHVKTPIRKMTAMAPQTAHPWRWFFTMRPR